jgi:serine protease
MSKTDAMHSLLTAGLVFALSGPASAETFTLAELDAGQAFTVGTLEFSDWNFDEIFSTVDPSVVTVETIDDPLEPGFTVYSNGELSGNDSVLEYEFTVSTTDDEIRMAGGLLALTDQTSPAGSEINVTLDEDVAPGEVARLSLAVTVSDFLLDLSDAGAIPLLQTFSLDARASGADADVNSYTTQFVLIGPFQVSGTIAVGAGTAMDSDVNDPNAPYLANDTPGTSQLIPAPAMVGGYLNNPGAGPVGRSKVAGDVVDAFRTGLPAGANVTLYIAEDDGATHDLDLLLYDVSDTDTPVDSSMSTERREQVTAPDTGDFYVVVSAVPGATDAATGYLLVIALGAGVGPAFNLSLEDDFADQQAIVHFAKEAATGAFSSSFQERADRDGLEPLAGAPGRPMLFELGGSATQAHAAALSSAQPESPLDAWLPADPEKRKKLETLWQIKQLRRRDDVEAADPNYRRYATAVPNDELYGNQWHYEQINLPQAWDSTTGSSDTVVAVIDTGVLRDHPDLQGPLLTGVGSGYDFIRDPNISNDGDGIDAEWNDNGDRPGGLSSFHGTHVSGTIAASTNNGIGVAGVNWHARIMPLRVLGVGGGFSYDIQQAVRYAAGLPNDSNTLPPRKADIMNLSLGGIGSSQTEQATYLEAREEGVIIIASAGNDEWSIRSYPAAYDGVISVSATDFRKRLSSYSNFGSTIDVAAPGGGDTPDLNGDGNPDYVLSSLAEDLGPGIRFLYSWYKGTSMSAPHVAGVVSLMKAIDPDMTPAEFDIKLAAGALTEDLGAAGRDDEFGHGLIDAQKAVIAAGAEPPIDPMLVVTPTALNFGLGVTDAELSVRQVGGGDLMITNVSNDSGGWLSVTGTDIDASNLGTYTASVERAVLEDGVYAATITFESTAGPVDVQVVMQTGLELTGDAGFQYIRLIDADTFETVAETSSAVEDGIYDFVFLSVPAGTYFLASGADSDNDSALCEVGDGCGGYPVLSQLGPISVEGDVSGLDFTTSFLSALFVPEPSSAALQIAALATLVGLARRRWRRS